jgi:hypothetical protein
MNARLGSILLITIWIIQYMFPTIWYSYTRFKLHQTFVQTQTTFKQKDVTTIQFTNPKLIHWESNHSEISYQNQLYDVISEVSRKGRTIFKCKLDVNETHFLKTYYKLKTEQKVLAFKLFKSVPIAPFSSIKVQTIALRSFEQSNAQFSLEQWDKPNSRSFKVPHQPPEKSCFS